MAPTIRTENALKRSEELLAVSQEGSALQTLHDAIVNKKHRAFSEELESAMMKHISLCVTMRKGRFAKEALHQYKNVCQNSKPQSIDKVVKHFLELSEGQVNTAKEKAEKILEGIDDLDAIQTPERIIMSAVTGEDTKDRTDREVVTPWLKFLWESYRTALDVLRNNANLLVSYDYTARQAFHFCEKYARKTEFRRLSEILRNHLIGMAKLTSQYSVSLNDPESLQRLIGIRFVQLEVAMALELWQEAFKSIEDIHRLMTRSKNKLKTQQLIEYYQQLSKIFFVSGNYLFHAYSLKMHFLLIRQSASAEDKVKIASKVVVAALAIPDVVGVQSSVFVDVETQQAKLTRLASIIGLNKIPTREMLLKELMSQDIMDNVATEVKNLYKTLEQEFSPLTICEKVAPILGFLEKDEMLCHYVQPLKTVSLTRLLQQLGQIFKTIKLESVFQLATFSTPHEVEKFMMESCRRGDLHIRINHLNGSVTFNTKSLGDLGGDSQLGGVHLQTNDVTSQFARLRSSFENALAQTDPKSEEKKKKDRLLAIQDISSRLEQEYNQAKEKRDIIQKTKQRMDELNEAKEKEAKQKKLEQQQKELAAEKLRLQEEAKRREQERIEKEKLEIERKNKLKIAETLAKKTDIKIDTSKIDEMSPEEIIAMQAQQIELAKKELQDKLQKLAKRMDHMERAHRKEEIPLLQNDYIKQQTSDKENAEKKYVQDVEASQEKHRRDLEMKQKIVAFSQDAQVFKDIIMEKRQKEMASKVADLEAKKQKEKQERREYHEKKMEKMKQEWIETQEKKKKQREEEEERIRRQQEADAKKKRDAADLESKLKQTATDMRQSSTSAEPKGRYVPPSARRQDSDSTPTSSSGSGSSSGRYVPPSARKAESDDRKSEDAPPSRDDRFGALRDDRDRNRSSFGDRDRDRDRPSFRDDRDRGDRSYGGDRDRPSYGGDRDRDRDRPSYGGGDRDRPSFRDDRDRGDRSYGGDRDRPSYGGDRDRDRDRPSFRDDRDRGESRQYRDDRRDDRDRAPPREEQRPSASSQGSGDKYRPPGAAAAASQGSGSGSGDGKYRPPGARQPSSSTEGGDGWQVVNKKK